MKTLIVYDSVFGNTELIAQAIFNGIENKEEAFLCKPDGLNKELLNNINLLIVGSPTRGFRPTEPITKFINSLEANSLNGVKVTSFDTRYKMENIKSGVLRIMVKVGGYADKTILKLLEKKGGEMVMPSEGFYVSTEKGPLYDSEIERATQWAKDIVSKF